MKNNDTCPMEKCQKCVSFFKGKCRTLRSTRGITDYCAFFKTPEQMKQDEEYLKKRIEEGYITQEIVNYYASGGDTYGRTKNVREDDH